MKYSASSCITFSPLHFLFNRGKSITFGTVWRSSFHLITNMGGYSKCPFCFLFIVSFLVRLFLFIVDIFIHSTVLSLPCYFDILLRSQFLELSWTAVNLFSGKFPFHPWGLPSAIFQDCFYLIL